MSEQLSLLDWRQPAEILPFPFHRSHGLTAHVARAIAHVETAKRTGRLNSIRAQTRKRMEPVFGADMADKIADDLVRMVRIQLAYQEPSSTPIHKQIKKETMIVSLPDRRKALMPYGNGGGAAAAMGQGAKLLAGLGGAHEALEYDAARTRDGGAA